MWITRPGLVIFFVGDGFWGITGQASDFVVRAEVFVDLWF